MKLKVKCREVLQYEDGFRYTFDRYPIPGNVGDSLSLYLDVAEKRDFEVGKEYELELK